MAHSRNENKNELFFPSSTFVKVEALETDEEEEQEDLDYDPLDIPSWGEDNHQQSENICDQNLESSNSADFKPAVDSLPNISLPDQLLNQKSQNASLRTRTIVTKTTRESREQKLEKDRERHRRKRESETKEERRIRLAKEQERKRQRRLNETDEERQVRLLKDRERTRRSRARANK